MRPSIRQHQADKETQPALRRVKGGENGNQVAAKTFPRNMDSAMVTRVFYLTSVSGKDLAFANNEIGVVGKPIRDSGAVS